MSQNPRTWATEIFRVSVVGQNYSTYWFLNLLAQFFFTFDSNKLNVKAGIVCNCQREADQGKLLFQFHVSSVCLVGNY